MIDISVIIPVYNVVDYITDCLNSVFIQTFRGTVQVIIVDDCGTDNSITLANDFVRDHQREGYEFLLLHHDNNRGLSAARNTGLDSAKGQYVIFLDSDDQFTPDCLQLMWNYVEHDSTIYMVVGQYQLTGNESGFSKLPPEGIYDSTTSDFHSFAANQKVYVQAWNKLYRKEYLDKFGFRFPEGLNYEDVYWSYVTLCKMQRFAVVDKPTYLYLVRSGSILRADGNVKRAYHSCQIFLMLQSFIFEQNYHNEYWQFHFVDTQFRGYYSELLKCGELSKAKTIYSILRKTEQWNNKQLRTFGITKAEFLMRLHQYLPRPLGFIWFNKMILYITNKHNW